MVNLFRLRRLAGNLTRSFCLQTHFSRADTLVVISQTDCIYENLSIEDWLYENLNLPIGQRLLFIYRNKPCVVIGKFQNQWVEADVGYMAANSIQLARRKSGGGTVYHDMGNINLSFITHRQDYNRQYNLNIITDKLNEVYPHLNLRCNMRDDIVQNGVYKVSGSAARMTRTKAYHHCTLLVNSDKRHLRSSLQAPFKNDIETSASPSIASPVTNLSSPADPVSIEDVIQVVVDAFIEKHHGSSSVKGRIFIEHVQCDDNIMPGVKDIQSELQSWQWIYGKTPAFTVRHKDDHLPGQTLTVKVINGLVKEMELHSHRGLIDLTPSYLLLPFCPLTLYYHYKNQTGISKNPLLKSLISKMRLNINKI